ncbi:MAG TPA: hypothetical protein VNO14_10275 [Blastocatellia bacterium]|nr:hypothetical protein [Blastocatellia bacterium]
MEVKDDPTIGRIREVRQKVSEECGHDAQRVVEYYRELQKKYQGRMIYEPEQESRSDEPVKV